MIDFSKYEVYDTSKQQVIPFYKKNDIINNMRLPFGNMNNGFPINIKGINFANVEIAYICGFFGNKDDKCIEIQKLLSCETNGMMAKRKYRKSEEYKIFGRKDFDESLWHYHWMLYLVWTKCTQNKEFSDLLLSLPKDCIIVENEPRKGDYPIWGCINKELNKICYENSKYLKQISTLTQTERKRLEDFYRLENYNCGIWKGYNSMGKILMECRDSLLTNRQPHIDTHLLNNAQIYWFGEVLIF